MLHWSCRYKEHATENHGEPWRDSAHGRGYFRFRIGWVGKTYQFIFLMGNSDWKILQVLACFKCSSKFAVEQLLKAPLEWLTPKLWEQGDCTLDCFWYETVCLWGFIHWPYPCTSENQHGTAKIYGWKLLDDFLRTCTEWPMKFNEIHIATCMEWPEIDTTGLSMFLMFIMFLMKLSKTIFILHMFPMVC